jgi:hypothetical protein
MARSHRSGLLCAFCPSALAHPFTANIRRSVIELSDCTDHDAWSAMLVAGSARKRLAQVPCPPGRGGWRVRIWVFCAGAWAPLSTACSGGPGVCVAAGLSGSCLSCYLSTTSVTSKGTATPAAQPASGKRAHRPARRGGYQLYARPAHSPPLPVRRLAFRALRVRRSRPQAPAMTPVGTLRSLAVALVC